MNGSLLFEIFENGINAFLSTANDGSKIVRLSTIIKFLTGGGYLKTDDLIKLGTHVIKKFRLEDPFREFDRVNVPDVQVPITRYVITDLPNLWNFCKNWLDTDNNRSKLVFKTENVMTLVNIVKKQLRKGFDYTMEIEQGLFNVLLSNPNLSFKEEIHFTEKLFYLDARFIANVFYNSKLSKKASNMLNRFINRYLSKRYAEAYLDPLEDNKGMYFPFCYFVSILSAYEKWSKANKKWIKPNIKLLEETKN